jgi:predicted MFS family arabinose efflux permease
LLVGGLMARESRRFVEARKDRHFSLTAIVDLLRLPAAQVVLTTVFLEGCLVFGGLAFLGASMLDRYSFLGPSQVGLMLAGFGLGGLFYSISVKRLVPRIGERGILLLGGSLLFAASILIGFLPRWWLFIPGMVIYGMGYYTMHGTLQTRATEMNPQARSTAVSLFAFIFFLGQGIGPVAMGQAIRTGGYGVGFVAGGTGLLALALWAHQRFGQLARASRAA